MRDEARLEAFRALVQEQQRERYLREYPRTDFTRNWTVRVKHGKRWVKVDVGTSGKYMVDEDGTIYGIKGYGSHKGHRYGTLDTIHEWDWSGYAAVPRPRNEQGRNDAEAHDRA